MSEFDRALALICFIMVIPIGIYLWVVNGGIERLKMCLAEWIKKREAALNVRKQKR